MKIDFDTVEAIPEPDKPEGGYAQRIANIGAFADGGQHTLVFDHGT